MQNPFKNRPQDDFARLDTSDDRWETRDQRYDENRTWTEGDGGRTARAYGDQGYSGDRSSGQDRYQGRDRDMSGSRGWGYGQDRQSEYGRGMSTGHSGGRESSRGDYGEGRGYGQDRHQGGGDWRSSSRGYEQGSYGQRSDYGQGSRYGSGHYGRDQGSQNYSAQGYAPGAEIWQGSGRDVEDRGRSARSGHDFEPDYLHWRDQQMSSFDKDYSDWRDERRQKFSSDFDNWRSSRPKTQAENPIVGDVTDGGTGDAREAKKS